MPLLAATMPITSYLFIGFVIVFFPLLGWVLYRHMMNKDWVRGVNDERRT